MAAYVVNTDTHMELCRCGAYPRLWFDDFDEWYSVICPECDAYSKPRFSTEEAIETWNKHFAKVVRS